MTYTLWLKAGADGSRLGGDSSVQHIFMTMLMKEASDPSLKFEVRTLNETRPPAEFRLAGLRHTPSLQTPDDEGLHQIDDIMAEIDKYGPRFPPSEVAEDATADIFRQFAFYIKDVNKDASALLTELKRVNDFLEANGTVFLTSDQPTYLDCLILPRLHSIRVAAKTIKELDIPPNLSSLWKYLRSGYDLEIFKASRPCDQEIILHWGEKQGVTLSASKKSQLARQTVTFTDTIPI